MPIKSDINIQLLNPDYLRKNVLESAICSNEVQQSVLKIKELQALKRKRIGELKKKINEISELSKTLQLKEFPQFKEKREKVEVIKEKPKRGKRIEPAKTTEENDLVRELNEIKSKLDSIYI